jgi:hypothetical protein
MPPCLSFALGVGLPVAGKPFMPVGIGPGPAAATLRVPTAEPLRSRFGATQPAADGGYRFTGTDICCDILE